MVKLCTLAASLVYFETLSVHGLMSVSMLEHARRAARSALISPLGREAMSGGGVMEVRKRTGGTTVRTTRRSIARMRRSGSEEASCAKAGHVPYRVVC